MDSPWQNPLPTAEHTTNQVVVYFYSEYWIPITCFCLSEAIALYSKALVRGKRIFVFPPGLELETKNILLAQSPELQADVPI